MRQVIGYFIVSHHDGTERVVLVNQDTTTDSSGVIVTARKHFTLDTVDGEEVYGSVSDRSFSTKDGHLLKIQGHCITNETALMLYQANRRRKRF